MYCKDVKKITSNKMTYGYITKSKRIRASLPKEHYIDAFCIAGNLQAKRLNYYYYQKQVHKHNRQIHKLTINKGGTCKRNQLPFKILGYRLFDKVLCKGEVGFIFGRWASGSFDIRKLDGTKISVSISYKKLVLISKRKTYLTERRGADTPALAVGKSHAYLMKQLLHVNKVSLQYKFDKDYIPVYSIINDKDELIDDNSGKGYIHKSQVLKKIDEINNFLYKKKLEEITDLNKTINNFFKNHKDFINFCRANENTLSLYDFEQALQKFFIFNLPCSAKYIYFYFLNGPFSLTKKNTKKKKLTPNQRFNQFVKNFNKSILLKTKNN